MGTAPNGHAPLNQAELCGFKITVVGNGRHPFYINGKRFEWNGK